MLCEVCAMAAGAGALAVGGAAGTDTQAGNASTDGNCVWLECPAESTYFILLGGLTNHKQAQRANLSLAPKAPCVCVSLPPAGGEVRHWTGVLPTAARFGLAEVSIRPPLVHHALAYHALDVHPGCIVGRLSRGQWFLRTAESIWRSGASHKRTRF